MGWRRRQGDVQKTKKRGKKKMPPKPKPRRLPVGEPPYPRRKPPLVLEDL